MIARRPSQPARARLLGAICTAAAVFAVAPSTASACASLAGIHAFVGHTRMTFSGTASGPVVGSGGNERIALQRSAASVEVKLTHRVRGKGQFSAIYFYSGKARLGNVSVHDSFELSEDNSSAQETYGGPLKSKFGHATLALDTDDCKYQFSAGFGAKTSFSGDEALRAGASVSASVYGDRNRIPKNLYLDGGVGPAPYLTCPGDPLLTGVPCFEIGGGWANDFAELSECKQFPPEPNCGSGDKQLAGSAEFIWVLEPK